MIITEVLREGDEEEKANSFTSYLVPDFFAYMCVVYLFMYSGIVLIFVFLLAVISRYYMRINLSFFLFLPCNFLPHILD